MKFVAGATGGAVLPMFLPRPLLEERKAGGSLGSVPGPEETGCLSAGAVNKRACMKEGRSASVWLFDRQSVGTGGFYSVQGFILFSVDSVASRVTVNVDGSSGTLCPHSMVSVRNNNRSPISLGTGKADFERRLISEVWICTARLILVDEIIRFAFA